MYRDVPLLYQLYRCCTMLYCCTSCTGGFALTAITEVVLFMCEHHHFNLTVNHPHQPYIKLQCDGSDMNQIFLSSAGPSTYGFTQKARPLSNLYPVPLPILCVFIF